MKLAKLTNDKFFAALNKLSSEPLPLKSAFKLKTINNRSREEYLKYDETRKEALKRFGQKNEDGTVKTDERGNVVFEENGVEKFVSEMEGLMAVDIELPALKTSELGDAKLSAVDLELLSDVLVED